MPIASELVQPAVAVEYFHLRPPAYFRMSKRRAVAKVDDAHGELDYLSCLPDELLSHILSFLTVEGAVRLKLLSRRWRHLYPANPTLEFFFYPEDAGSNGSDFDINEWKFVNSVNLALWQFRAPKIASLNLSLTEHLGTEYARNVDEWIRLACTMKAEKIYLFFVDSVESYIFPFHLLRVSELSHLKHLDIVSCSLPPFPSLDGPIVSLRKLELSMVSFIDKNWTFDDIATYCPYLESLAITDCEPPSSSMRYLCRRLYHLKSLDIGFCSGSQDFEIHDANLTEFKFDGNVKNISLKGLNCLQSLDVRVKCCVESSQCCGGNLANFLSTLPKGAPQLKKLSLCMYQTKVEDIPFPTSMSTFKCLKFLDLSISSSPNTDLQMLSKILHVVPVLRKFKIYLRGRPAEWSLICLEEQLVQMHKRHLHSQREQHASEVHPVHSLKEVEISRSCCLGKNDVEFAFMLKSVTSLKVLFECTVEKVSLSPADAVNHFRLQRALAEYRIDVNFITY